MKRSGIIVLPKRKDFYRMKDTIKTQLANWIGQYVDITELVEDESSFTTFTHETFQVVSSDLYSRNKEGEMKRFGTISVTEDYEDSRTKIGISFRDRGSNKLHIAEISVQEVKGEKTKYIIEQTYHYPKWKSTHLSPTVPKNIANLTQYEITSYDFTEDLLIEKDGNMFIHTVTRATYQNVTDLSKLLECYLNKFTFE